VGVTLGTALSYGRRPVVRQRWADELRRLVALPTVSGSPAHRPVLEAAAAQLCGRLQRIGLTSAQVLRAQRGAAPSVWAEWAGQPGRPTVLLYSHFDVQPAGPDQAWPLGPFSGAVRGGRVLGRGASDNKGSLVTQLAALESYFVTAGGPPVNVRIWFEGEEEAGSPSLRRLLDVHSERFHAHCVALSDASRPAGVDRPTLVVGLRGVLDVSVTVEGPSISMHSGLYGGEVLDPSMVLARLVASLWGREGRVGVPGFYHDVCLPTGEDRRRLAEGRPSAQALVEAMGGAGQLLGECGWAVGERSMFRPSVAVTELVAGGEGRDGRAPSAIAREASARLNFRLVPDQRPEEVARLVRRHFARVAPPPAKVRIEVRGGALPVVVPHRHPVVMAAARALATTWGAPPVLTRNGGSIPVVAELYRRYRLPVAIWGLSSAADRIHAGGESFPLSELFRGCEAVVRFLGQLAS